MHNYITVQITDSCLRLLLGHQRPAVLCLHTHTVVTCTVNAFSEALSTFAVLPDHYEAFVFLISLDCVFFIPLFFRSLTRG